MMDEWKRTRRNQLRKIRQEELKLEDRIAACGNEFERTKLGDQRSMLLRARELAMRAPRYPV
jgi:hypothetical protein